MTPAAKDVPSEEYVVVNCGASYCLPGLPDSRRFAIKDDIINLDPNEVERLTALHAVCPLADLDPEKAAEVLARREATKDPAPVGKEHAEELESKAAHAEGVKSRKRGKAEAGAQAPAE
jgi:hypothetical protein